MRIFTLFLCLAMTGWLHAQTIIDEQDFNSLSDCCTFNTDMLPTGGTLTNAGTMNGGTGLSGFSTRWFSTGEPVGPVTQSGDSNDFIGVNSFSGSNAPSTAPDGTPVSSGSEHNFQFNDGDGILVLNFDPVDLSGFTSRRIQFSYWVAATGYESDDQFRAVVLGSGGTGATLVNLGETGLEAVNGNWVNVDIDLESIIATYGEMLSLQFEVTTNSGSENIFVDEIRFTGIADLGNMACNELFFSEYIEGSGNNKCLEIYNPTGSAVSLSGYSIDRYTNGSATVSGSEALSGTIPAYGTYVICNPSSAGNFLAKANATSSVLIYNGDDAVALSKNGTNIDVIGRIGEDPGSQWGTGSTSTQNATLVRMSSVTMGDSNGSDSFDPAAEWMGLPQDSEQLGSHSSDCAPMVSCMITDVTISGESACNDNGTIYTDDDYYTADVTVSFEGEPADGDLEVYINGQLAGSVPAAALNGSPYTFEDVVLPTDGQDRLVTAEFTSDGLCKLTLTVGANQQPCSTIPACTELFFSEYTEGSSFNKCLEIYNPTDFDIDLSQYEVSVYFNGQTSPGSSSPIMLNGTIPAGGVYVICNPGAGFEFLAQADQTDSGIAFNGNDAVVLQDGNGIIDAIGQIGNSSSYGSNVTLQRSYYVQSGDNNPYDSFDPNNEWVTLPANTAYTLGYHSGICQPSLGPGSNVTSIGNCDGTATPTATGIQITTDCTPSSPTQDELTFAFVQSCGSNMQLEADVSVGYSGYAGLMFRENLTPGSPMVFLYVQPNGRAYFEYRASQNAPLRKQSKFAFGPYLRLVRQGSAFFGYTSYNGQSYQLQFYVSMPSMDDCLFIGAAAHSLTGQEVTANFNDFNLFQNNILRPNQTDYSFEQTELPVMSEEATLFPNPAVDQLQVELPRALAQDAVLRITDLNGRVLQQQQLPAGTLNERIDLPAAWPAGIYLLSVESAETSFTKRFVKGTR